MGKPSVPGRSARTRCLEAVDAVHTAARHNVAMREALYLILERQIDPEVRQLVLEALRRADQASAATDDALHYIINSELVFSRAARRELYASRKGATG